MIVTNAHEILSLMKAGKAAAKALRVARHLIQAGMSTADLNKIIEDVIRHEGCKAAFKKVPGYHWASCISINEEVVHGAPDPNRIIQPGDLVSIDTGAVCNGYFSDTAISLAIPPVSAEVANLIFQTERALYDAMSAAVAGRCLGDITTAIASVCDEAHISPRIFPIKDYSGHGVGMTLHEPPAIPNYAPDKTGVAFRTAIEPGSVLAIEPMITYGSGETEVLPNGWTVVTKDKKLTAHCEHTILVTEQGVTILTEDK